MATSKDETTDREQRIHAVITAYNNLTEVIRAPQSYEARLARLYEACQALKDGEPGHGD